MFNTAAFTGFGKLLPIFVLLMPSPILQANTTSPLVDRSVVFAERNGLLAVEAEHFFQQTKADVRAFHLTHTRQKPDVGKDGDPPHVAGASGGAYLEVLPDTRRTHQDKLVRGKNFSPQPGKLAVLSYRVFIKTPGRYYVWVRAYSTGTEDNGLHVGIDGQWPASGQRLQWCQGKNRWWWESRQRTQKEHCGEPYKIFLDIEKAGTHIIQFSMREDGFEFDKWFMTTQKDYPRPTGVGPISSLHQGQFPKSFLFVAADTATKNHKLTPSATTTTSQESVSSLPLQQPRKPAGDGRVQVQGELKQWHKVTLQLNGPFAHERDNQPNPFTDYRFQAKFTHADGTEYVVPGFFAADGNAANTSAASGTIWQVHFAPDRVGRWNYDIGFYQGKHAALGLKASGQPVKPFHGRKGSFEVTASDKTGRDFRAHGRLQYVGKHYLQHAGSKKYFLKAGADAPETLLAYQDFDNTVALKPRRAPLKSWKAHEQDWNAGDPVWQNRKGKGLIGAVNYLAEKGCNAFSFLTYNAGGDGDNVWPFLQRDDKLHYDCSKLDQWGIVFDHATERGMYLHFKLQETENDDNRRGKKNDAVVKESLDGGNLGVQRKLYCREIVARFGHNLGLNWNLGEENTQSTQQQQDMINYLLAIDPYDHHLVIHTFPDQQDRVYRPLLGQNSRLTGVSLQNSSLAATHAQTVKWVRASRVAGKPWVVAFDESGSAAHGQCPDLGYRGFDGRDRTGKMIYTQHQVRKQTLWGTLLAGGAGNEYYFGYQFAENDLVCEDWRSRDQSWDYCRIAIEFFHQHDIPFWEMTNADELVGNPEHNNSRYCFAKPNSLYLVYLPDGGSTKLDLRKARGKFELRWFNPRTGGKLQVGTKQQVTAGTSISLGNPPADADEDWLVVIRRASP